jgi:sugar lactone lactonase YvrE
MYQLRRKGVVSAGLVLLVVTTGVGRTEEPPRVFLSDGKDLMWVRQRVAAGDAAVAAAVKRLRAQADRNLKAGPFTVVRAKPVKAPSGDPHDYVSMGPYWWPDPDKADGLPYIRRDGRINPEREKFDAPQMGRMAEAVSTLALAYYLTGEERYATHAARLLRGWFLDKATRMNPNLNYGQFVPGLNQGRSTGIIDTVRLLKVVDAIGMLRGAKDWRAADQKGMEAWFRQYLHWLQTNKLGKGEAAAGNNHGSWYDAQVAVYALFLGDRATAKRVVEESKKKRIARQIEPDGRQPLELKRTKAFGYSVTNLRGLVALATLGQQVGVDLWRYKTDDGRSLRQALDWLLPFATGEKKWPYRQITRLSAGSLAPILRQAARVYEEPRYEQAIGRLARASRGDDTTDLLFPRLAAATRSADTGESIFAPDAKLKVEAVGGAGGEGPAWDPKLGVLTSGNDHIYRLDRAGKSRIYHKDAGTNGLLFDRHGRLLACEPKQRRITRTERDGKITVLTDRYQGKRYNEPNDLTVDSKGRIYFSDPRYGPTAGKDIRDKEGRIIEGVYRIDPEGKVVRVIGREVERPNGVLVSADDRFLYVADNNNNHVGGARKLWRFDLHKDGSMDLASRKLLYDWGKGRGPDGVKQDQKGRLYVAAGLNKPNPPYEPARDKKGGIYVLSPAGKLLDFLPVPRDEVTNCAFGGDDLKTLFITAGGTLYSIRTTTPGRVVWPAAKPSP